MDVDMKGTMFNNFPCPHFFQLEFSHRPISSSIYKTNVQGLTGLEDVSRKPLHQLRRPGRGRSLSSFSFQSECQLKAKTTGAIRTCEPAEAPGQLHFAYTFDIET